MCLVALGRVKEAKPLLESSIASLTDLVDNMLLGIGLTKYSGTACNIVLVDAAICSRCS